MKNLIRVKSKKLSELGKDEEAIELFDKALEIKPDDYTGELE
jgi:tetratricopeptide (TPR) repeat protein